jgi:lysophospholipase L1-like esterase
MAVGSKVGGQHRGVASVAKAERIRVGGLSRDRIGHNDVTSQRAPRQFLQDYRRLVEEVRRRTGIVGLVATGLPPLRILPAAQHPLRWYLGRYAARLDRMLQRWISQDAAARYVSLDWAAKPLEMARDRFHPGARQYRRWAELVSEQIVDLLVKERVFK